RPNVLRAMVKNRTHWQHARHVLANRWAGAPERVRKDGYRALLKIAHVLPAADELSKADEADAAAGLAAAKLDKAGGTSRALGAAGLKDAGGGLAGARERLEAEERQVNKVFTDLPIARRREVWVQVDDLGTAVEKGPLLGLLQGLPATQYYD